MSLKIRELWVELRSSLWFLPFRMVLGAVVLALPMSDLCLRRRVLWMHVEQIIELADESVTYRHGHQVLDEQIIPVVAPLSRYYARPSILLVDGEGTQVRSELP